MPLVKGDRIVEDTFVRLPDGGPVPEGASVLVPGARFLADTAVFSARDGRTGVLWPNDRTVSDLAPHLHQLGLIALIFPTFRDGRAYTQARHLRERYGYRGELRATCDVLRDQFLFLARAGFDAFEVKKDIDALAFREVISRYSVFYQPMQDGRWTAARARLTGDRYAAAPSRREAVS